MAIKIIDVPSILNAGYKGGKISQLSYKGIKTGGLCLLANLLAQCYRNGELPILLWDSRTNRRDYYPEYKSSRNPDKTIRSAYKFSYEYLKNVVPNSFKVEGYEADDLAFSVGELLRNNDDFYLEYHTTDYDWAHNIVDNKQTLVPANSNVYFVNNINFEGIFSTSKFRVPLNSISMLKVATEDKSDNIKLFWHPDLTRAEIFKIMKSFCKKQGISTREKTSMINFIETYKSVLGEERSEELRNRCEVVYPRKCTEDFNIQMKILNEQEFSKFLSIIGCKSIANRLGLKFYNDMGEEQKKANIAFNSETLLNPTHYFSNSEKTNMELKIPQRGGFV